MHKVTYFHLDTCPYCVQADQVIAELILRGMEENFTVTDLEEIYPTASKKCKEESDTYDKAFAEEAHRITGELQNGNAQYRKIWEKIRFLYD